MTRLVITVILGAAMLFPMPLLVWVFVDFVPGLPLPKYDWFVSSIWAGFVMVFLLLLGEKPVGRLSARASRHFLAIGVVLFFFSRLIALYASVVKAGFFRS